jgi:hypothetical protein
LPFFWNLKTFSFHPRYDWGSLDSPRKRDDIQRKKTRSEILKKKNFCLRWQKFPLHS